jgi:intracellular sulfur oxidation DsrE/DsrF family protein
MVRIHAQIALVALFVVCAVLPASAGNYDHALNGVKEFDAVFDFTHGNPQIANIILQAIDMVDDADEVTSMQEKPKLAIVFHDAAVHLLSTERGDYDDAEWAEVQKFQSSLKAMEEQGVILEVCAYALDVFGVDRDSVIPQVDQVPNGFVSVVGYQQQGYSLVRIP